MGMRTMLYTVAEDINGQITVNGYYGQWGIGRIMPLAVITIIINCFRNEKARWKHYDYPFENAVHFDYEAQRFSLEFSEHLQGNLEDNRFVWETPSLIGTVTNQFDNNNGACVLYAKQVPVSESKSGNEMDIEFRLGFLLGFSDAWSEGEDPKLKRLGKPFQRWLTLDEWASLQCNRNYTDKPFLSWFKGFLNEFDVTIMKSTKKTENEEGENNQA